MTVEEAQQYLDANWPGENLIAVERGGKYEIWELEKLRSWVDSKGACAFSLGSSAFRRVFESAP